MSQHKNPIRASADIDPTTGDITGVHMLLSDENVDGIGHCMGVATVPAGAPVTDALAHSTDETMFVAQGQGELVTTLGSIAFAKGDAIFIPADLKHALKNTGGEALVSVFSFSAPNRPKDSADPR